jgi:hypothetical protein
MLGGGNKDLNEYIEGIVNERRGQNKLDFNYYFFLLSTQ